MQEADNSLEPSRLPKNQDPADLAAILASSQTPGVLSMKALNSNSPSQRTVVGPGQRYVVIPGDTIIQQLSSSEPHDEDETASTSSSSNLDEDEDDVISSRTPSPLPTPAVALPVSERASQLSAHAPSPLIHRPPSPFRARSTQQELPTGSPPPRPPSPFRARSTQQELPTGSRSRGAQSGVPATHVPEHRHPRAKVPPVPVAIQLDAAFKDFPARAPPPALQLSLPRTSLAGESSSCCSESTRHSDSDSVEPRRRYVPGPQEPEPSRPPHRAHQPQPLTHSRTRPTVEAPQPGRSQELHNVDHIGRSHATLQSDRSRNSHDAPQPDHIGRSRELHDANHVGRSRELHDVPQPDHIGRSREPHDAPQSDRYVQSRESRPARSHAAMEDASLGPVVAPPRMIQPPRTSPAPLEAHAPPSAEWETIAPQPPRAHAPTPLYAAPRGESPFPPQPLRTSPSRNQHSDARVPGGTAMLDGYENDVRPLGNSASGFLATGGLSRSASLVSMHAQTDAFYAQSTASAAAGLRTTWMPVCVTACHRSALACWHRRGGLTQAMATVLLWVVALGVLIPQCVSIFPCTSAALIFGVFSLVAALSWAAVLQGIVFHRWARPVRVAARAATSMLQTSRSVHDFGPRFQQRLWHEVQTTTATHFPTPHATAPLHPAPPCTDSPATHAPLSGPSGNPRKRPAPIAIPSSPAQTPLGELRHRYWSLFHRTHALLPLFFLILAQASLFVNWMFSTNCTYTEMPTEYVAPLVLCIILLGVPSFLAWALLLRLAVHAARFHAALRALEEHATERVKRLPRSP